MSMKLTVLGLLMEGEKHPYEVQQIVKNRQMKYYIKMAPGSLYYAFEKLKDDGFIEVSKVIKDTNRPDKTIYAITDRGVEEFQSQLLKQLGHKEQLAKPIYAALSFANYSEPEKMKEKLKKKIEFTEDYIEKMKLVYHHKKDKEDRAKMYIILGVMMQLKTELIWLKRIEQDLVDGNLQKTGDLDLIDNALPSIDFNDLYYTNGKKG
ncbi:PadR family transcriptional regulator [Falsibacillus albus]|uniref:PadR family transcriptional regulator n=1 Tax=Falsibacillus albus TaxID=2478915 RepID=A0A3L7JSJ7_9BACI|nr:PadR family transcriptional regulator [Falsibacillus albus]RLQ93235.1 PadR family transcriptional regulator [Falsibacillus albus]